MAETLRVAVEGQYEVALHSVTYLRQLNTSIGILFFQGIATLPPDTEAASQACCATQSSTEPEQQPHDNRKNNTTTTPLSF